MPALPVLRAELNPGQMFLSSSELKRMKTDCQIKLRVSSEDGFYALYIRIFKAAKILQPFSQPFILFDTQEKPG